MLKKRTNKILPYILQTKFINFFLFLNNLENFLLNKNLNKINYKKIIICGYPRSGTSLITSLINTNFNVSSFEYRDLPFILCSYFWNKINNLYYWSNKDFQRAHNDKLLINSKSPDSFEEILWSIYLEDYKKKGFKKILDEKYENKELEFFLDINIKKIIFIRNKKPNYISKNNYSLFRLKYLLKIHPSTKFIVCIRNPIEQCYSAAITDLKFYNEAIKNKKFYYETNFLCHFEFGYNKKSLREGGGDNKNYSSLDNSYIFYLQEWIFFYEFFLNKNYKDKKIKESILLIDYDDFITKKNDYLTKIFNYCNLEIDKKNIDYLKTIKNKDEYTNFFLKAKNKNILNLEIKAKNLYNVILNLK